MGYGSFGSEGPNKNLKLTWRLGWFWALLVQMICTPPHLHPKYEVGSEVNVLVEDPFKDVTLKLLENNM